MSFSPIHVFDSVYLRNGTCEVKELLKEFKSFGVKAVAICNHGNLIGAMKFFLAAKEVRVTPVIGMQVDIFSDAKPNTLISLKLYAFNMVGYLNLVALSSFAFLEDHELQLKINKEQLEKHHEGLYCFIGNLEGEASRDITDSPFELEKDAVIYCVKVFGTDNLFVELQANESLFHQLTNEGLIKIAREFNLPLIATKKISNEGELSNRFHYIYPSLNKKNCKERERLSAKDRIDFVLIANIFYLDADDEYLKIIPLFSEIIENTKRLLSNVNLEIANHKKFYPKIEIPDLSSEMQYLNSLAIIGLKTRYKQVKLIHLNQLKYEIEIIEEKGLTSLVLVIWDICKLAEIKGFEVNSFLGQMGGSILAYALGIMDVDPLKFNLYFDLLFTENWPFNMRIIINANHKRHHELTTFFYKKYCENNISKLISPARKMCKSERRIRNLAGLLGVSKNVIDQFVPLIHPAFVLTYEEQLNNETILLHWCEQDPQVQGLVNLVEVINRQEAPKIDGCELIISDRPIVESLPLVISKNGIDAQLSWFEIKSSHLLKISIDDRLTFSEESIIKHTIDLICQSRKIYISINKISLNDKNTFNMITNGESIELPFNYQDHFFKKTLSRIKLNSFDDFILLINLCYRGYIEIDGKPYFSNWTSRFEINNEFSLDFMEHTILNDIVKETGGYIFYEEQVMRIANLIAGFSLVESFNFLKSLNHGRTETTNDSSERESHHQKFLNGCIGNGLSKALSEEIYQKINQIRHSSKICVLSMALPIYLTTYLKCNYPEEFLSTYFTFKMGEHGDYMADFAKECKRFNLEILSPDINESNWGFKPSLGKIRMGFGAIKGTGKRPIEEIIKARAPNPFQSIQDFCNRCVRHLGDIATFEAINNVGGFASIEKSSNNVIVAIKEAIESRKS